MTISPKNEYLLPENELRSASFDDLFRKYVRMVKEKHKAEKAIPITTTKSTGSTLHFLPAAGASPIWIVDDNPDIPILMRMVFNRIALVVNPTFFSDGDELISQLETTFVRPKVILLDIYLKRVDGFDTLRQIRTHPHHPDLPVVMLTSSFSESDRKKAMALGADEFMTKPTEFDHTVSLIHRVVQKWG